MTENEQEIIDSTNDTEETVNDEVELELETTEEEETITIPKNKWIEIQAQKEHWKNKANKVAKPESVQTVPSDKSPELSSLDTIAILRSDISEEDVPEVVRMAKLMGVTVSQALKDKAVMTILNVKKEERATASAASTQAVRRSSKVSDESLLDNAKSGKLPETDADIERLIKARMDARLKH